MSNQTVVYSENNFTESQRELSNNLHHCVQYIHAQQFYSNLCLILIDCQIRVLWEQKSIDHRTNNYIEHTYHPHPPQPNPTPLESHFKRSQPAQSTDDEL